MTPFELKVRLVALLGNAPRLERRAAKAIGVKERSVFRWLSKERSMPPWLNRMLDLAEACPKLKRPAIWR